MILEIKKQLSLAMVLDETEVTKLLKVLRKIVPKEKKTKSIGFIQNEPIVLNDNDKLILDSFTENIEKSWKNYSKNQE